MATGACGIDCTVCRLHLVGQCSSCGPAMSQLADLKIKTQERLLGAPCPLLACARMNRINHCLADCASFPCENFTGGPYPFSNGFLNMQSRRREQLEKHESHYDNAQVASEHWRILGEKDPKSLVNAAGVQYGEGNIYQFEMFSCPLRVLIADQRVEVFREQRWQEAAGLLALVAVMYLLTARPAPLSGQWCSEKDLSCASFFQGIHRLPLGRLVNQFGQSAQGFIEVAGQLGGTGTDDAGDGAMRLWLLPKVPVKLILWCRDEELEAAFSVLFDSSIEQFLPADAIWALVHLLADEMCTLAEQMTKR